MQILQVIAESKAPLSTRSIEKEILGPENVLRGNRIDIYDVIKNTLCIKKFEHDFFLFEWNTLISSIDEKREYRKKLDQSRVVKNLNNIGLKLNIPLVEFSKNENGTVIAITNGSNDHRLIQIQRESDDFATLRKGRNKLTVHLKIKKFGREEKVFYEGIMGNPVTEGTSYLKTSLNEKSIKEIQRIKSMNPDIFNCTNQVIVVPDKCLLSPELDDDKICFAAWEIEGNRKNWKYSLNTRGLIFYIIGKIYEEQERQRIKNVEISKVLENLSQNYKDEFPFLVNYREIKDLYERLAVEEGLPEYRYFQVKLIKRIALELQYSIDRIKKKELNYYIIKRYSDELTMRFVNVVSPGSLWAGMIGIMIPRVIRTYLAYNLSYMREYLREELENIEYDIDQYACV